MPSFGAVNAFDDQGDGPSGQGTPSNTLILLDRMLSGLSEAQPLMPLEYLRSNLLKSVSRIVEKVDVRMILASASGCWCVEVSLSCLEADTTYTAAVFIDHKGVDLEYDPRTITQVAHLVCAATPVFHRMQGCPLSLVDRTIESTTGHCEAGVLFAISFAALRAQASLLQKPPWLHIYSAVQAARRGSTPCDGSMAPTPTSLPVPCVTVFEGGECNGSDMLIEEIAILVYSTSIASALSIARKITERVRYEAQDSGSTYSIGVRGGWVVHTANLLPLLVALSAAIADSTSGLDRVKVVTHFGRGGQHYMGEVRLTYSVLDDCKAAVRGGLLHAAIDPFNAKSEDGWSVLQMLDMLLVADTVSPTSSLPLSGQVMDPKKHATVPRMVAHHAALRARQGCLVLVRSDVAESTDPYLVHCAVGLCCDWAMLGGLYSGERTALWNELLRIEDDLVSRGVRPFSPLPAVWR